MDFYKKIVKTKDTASVLSEKEYKCASLQAIANEAIKENNKKRLKELLDEINGHLADLRPLTNEKDAKNKEKCEKLIKQYQECLVKILNNRVADVLITITSQQQSLQSLANIAMRDNDLAELKKLSERMERNLEVMKEIPEIKDARSSENGDKRLLEAMNEYIGLLNKVIAHINMQKRIISGPVSLEEVSPNQTKLEENTQTEETLPLPPMKINPNEVEEKLKTMRQKRLNRLSTFVDQQTKLAEQRSRENSPKNSGTPNKSSENLSQIPEITQPETPIIRSSREPELIKPSLYKAAVQEKLAKPAEQKVFKSEQKYYRKIEDNRGLSRSIGKAGVSSGLNFNEKMTVMTASTTDNFQKSVSIGVSNVPQGKSAQSNVELTRVENVSNRDRNSFGKGGNTKCFPERQKESTKNQDNYPEEITSQSTILLNEGHNIKKSKVEPIKREKSDLARGTATKNGSSFGKGTVTRSFAERQIENARNQIEKPKPSKTTPPRTPTQIRKIFNSFNSCVLGANNSKSIEDLPSEFNSPFEQELKNVQLKNTGLASRMDSFKEKNKSDKKGNLAEDGAIKFKLKSTAGRSASFKERDNAELKNNEANKVPEVAPPLPAKRNKKPIEQPPYRARDALHPRQEIEKSSEVKIEERLEDRNRVGALEKSASQDHLNTQSTYFIEEDTKKKSSLDFDKAFIRHHNELDYSNQADIITIKRSSNPCEPSPERRSFSTFRSSCDSVKEENAVDNPLYAAVTYKNHSAVKDENAVDNPSYALVGYENRQSTTSVARQNSIDKDAMLISQKTKEMSDFYFNTLDFVIGENKKRVRNSSSSDTNRFIVLEPLITKLEYAIRIFRGLKRDEDYFWLDRLLSKYYVKVDEVPIETSFDTIEKNNLLERLKKASKDLESRVTKNEEILKSIFVEQVQIIGEKYGII